MELLPGDAKGIPGWAAGLTPEAYVARVGNVLGGEVPMPVCVLRESAVAGNSRRMMAYVASLRTDGGPEVVLAPHGKTSMAPELFHRQLADGAWAITLATDHQVRAARAAGVDRILLANELVDPAAIDFVVGELRRDPAFEFLCLVDSAAGVAALAEGVRRAPAGRPLRVLVEVGMPGGRCGVRDVAGAVAVAGAVREAAPHLELAGVEGYEGILDGTADVDGYLARVVEAATACAGRGLFDGLDRVLLSAGGSAFYDRVAAVLSTADLGRPVTVVLRSGCYLTHDSDRYRGLFADLLDRSPEARAAGLDFVPALEVWARVLSTPEPGLVVLGAGRRDFGHDNGYPLPVKRLTRGEAAPDDVAGAAVTAIHDQHAVLRWPADTPVAVGDLVALSPSHPCTTFDKWRYLHLVADDYTVRSLPRTFF